MSPASGQSKVGKVMSGTTDSAVWNWLAKNVGWLALLCGAVWVVADRTETPEASTKRLTEAIRPLADELSEVAAEFKAHDHLPGHPVSITRLDNVEKMLGEVRGDVKEVLKIARNGSK